MVPPHKLRTFVFQHASTLGAHFTIRFVSTLFLMFCPAFPQYKRKLYKKAKNTPKSLLGEYVKAQGGVPRDDSTFTFVQRPEDKRFGAVCTYVNHYPEGG